MDGCNRCENKSINKSNQYKHNVDILQIDITGVYKATNKSTQQTHQVYMFWIDITDMNINLLMRMVKILTINMSLQ